MMAERARGLTGLALLLALSLPAGGCNSSTDDPDVSDNLVTVAGADPTEACVDWDGEPGEDANGDPVTEFFGVNQSILLQSRPRGAVEDSVWQDVIFDEVRIAYEMEEGLAPPPRVEAVSEGTVPAGGTLDYPMETVLGSDVANPAYFEQGARGRIILEFRGENVAGKPATAEGNIRLFTASICEGGN